MARTGRLELVQGTLDMLVMKALTFGPQHGYAVAQWVRQTTEGRLDIEEGALYTALHRMERRGWLGSKWGVSDNNRRAKYYALTSEGQRRLREQAKTWTAYAEAVFAVLGSKEALA